MIVLKEKKAIIKVSILSECVCPEYFAIFESKCYIEKDYVLLSQQAASEHCQVYNATLLILENFDQLDYLESSSG